MRISAESVFLPTPKLLASNRRNRAKCSSLRKTVQTDSRKQSACFPPEPRDGPALFQSLTGGQHAQPPAGSVLPDSVRAVGSGRLACGREVLFFWCRSLTRGAHRIRNMGIVLGGCSRGGFPQPRAVLKQFHQRTKCRPAPPFLTEKRADFLLKKGRSSSVQCQPSPAAFTPDKRGYLDSHEICF